jgi:hypothetical protein
MLQGLEQRPLNMNHIDRISCCSRIIFERNFDPRGCKRALTHKGFKGNEEQGRKAKHVSTRDFLKTTLWMS